MSDPKQIGHLLVVIVLVAMGWFCPISELGSIIWIAAIFYGVYVAGWFLPPDTND